MSAEEFFESIDYALLRQQKQTLIETIDDQTEPNCDLDGILHLIDSLQDFAADVLDIQCVFED